MSNAEALIDRCILDGFTPDLPSLRYKGPIPVFLYGEMSGWKNFETVFKEKGLKLIEDYSTVDTNCDLACKLVMLQAKNPAKTRYPSYKSYAMVNFKSVQGLTPHPVRGRLLTVSLKGLMALDRHYFNGYRAERISLPIKKKDYSKYDWAYVYSFDALDFIDVDGGFKEEFEFSEMPTSTYNGVTVYTEGNIG